MILRHPITADITYELQEIRDLRQQVAQLQQEAPQQMYSFRVNRGMNRLQRGLSRIFLSVDRTNDVMVGFRVRVVQPYVFHRQGRLYLTFELVD